MTSTDFYILMVAIWDHAIAAGLEPVPARAFEPGEQYYREHEFYFDFPPTREDWWDLCRQTPWMAAFDPHRGLIDGNPWPLVLPGKKACDVDLMGEQARKVGRLAVYRHARLRNRPLVIPHIGVKVWDAVARGFRGTARDHVRLWVMTNEHRIAEEAMNRAPSGAVSDSLLVAVGKQLARQFWTRQKHACPVSAPHHQSIPYQPDRLTLTHQSGAA